MIEILACIDAILAVVALNVFKCCANVDARDLIRTVMCPHPGNAGPKSVTVRRVGAAERRDA